MTRSHQQAHGTSAILAFLAAVAAGLVASCGSSSSSNPDSSSSPAGVYAPNIEDGTVSVIDPDTNRVTTTVQIGGALLGVAISPDGAFAYVGGFAGAVSVIDTDTNAVVDTIAVGSAPRDIAFTPRGNIAYVTDQGLNAVWRINTATRAVVGSSIPVGNGATAIAITPNGAFAYVVNVCGDGACDPIAPGTVSIIDTRSNMVTRTVSVGYRPVGIAMAPGGAAAYVANQCGDDPNCNSDGTVSVVDAATQTVVDTIAVGQPGTQCIAMAPDGDVAYVSNTAVNTVSMIDTMTNRVFGSPIPVGSAPCGLAVTPDGQFIYVANQTDDSVSVIASATNTEVATVRVGNHPAFLAIKP